MKLHSLIVALVLLWPVTSLAQFGQPDTGPAVDCATATHVQLGDGSCAEFTGHTHTGSTISGLDLSDDTNAAGSGAVVLTDDTFSFDLDQYGVCANNTDCAVAATDTLVVSNAGVEDEITARNIGITVQNNNTGSAYCQTLDFSNLFSVTDADDSGDFSANHECELAPGPTMMTTSTPISATQLPAVAMRTDANKSVTTGVTHTYNSGSSLVISGDLDVASGGDIDVASGGNINIASGGDIEVASGGDVNVASGGKIVVAAGGDITLADAPSAATDAVNKTYSDARRPKAYLTGSTNNTNPGDGQNLLISQGYNTGVTFPWGNIVSQIVPDEMDCTDMRVKLIATTAPTAEDTTVTLYKNGSATGLTCDIDTATSARTCDVTSTVSFGEDDMYYFKVECTGTDCPVSGAFGSSITVTARCNVVI